WTWVTGMTLLPLVGWGGLPSTRAEACVAQLAVQASAEPSCGEKLASVCQKEHPVLSARGHAYRAFYGLYTWPEARDSCRALGGHLATINDEAEQSFLSSRFTGLHWLGARRMSVGGPLEW